MPDTGSRTDVLAAAPDAIIDVLLDFESYPEWQPSYVACEVLDRDDQGRGSRVRMTVDARIRKLQYLARYSYDLPHSLSWQQESGDLTDLRGRYTFRPQPDGGTEVGVDISFDAGFFVPGPVKRLIRDQALRTSMRELRRRVER